MFMFGALYYPLFPGIFVSSLSATSVKEKNSEHVEKKVVLDCFNVHLYPCTTLNDFFEFLILTLFKSSDKNKKILSAIGAEYLSSLGPFKARFLSQTQSPGC
jgi:hypothetical protein